MPGLGGFSIGVNSVFLVGKRPILGGLIDVRIWVFAGIPENFFNQDSLKNFQSKSN